MADGQELKQIDFSKDAQRFIFPLLKIRPRPEPPSDFDPVVIHCPNQRVLQVWPNELEIITTNGRAKSRFNPTICAQIALATRNKYEATRD